MDNKQIAKDIRSTVREATEMTEQWSGTLIADKLQLQAEAVVRGIEDGKLEDVLENLLPELKKTVDFAINTLEHQEN